MIPESFRDIHRVENGQVLAVSEQLELGLDSFWQRWGSQFHSIALHLPNFQDQHWPIQYYPKGYEHSSGESSVGFEVQGETISVPYYKIDHRQPKLVDALQDIVESAQDGGYGIIIDVGSADSLTPVTVAGAYDKTIVITLDPFVRPFDVYPAQNLAITQYSREYPYVAKVISEKHIQNSGAFYFPLNVYDSAVQQVLHENAWRVQVVAPDPEQDKDMLDIVNASANFVSPGGEMIITGDGFLTQAENLKLTFRPESYRDDTKEGIRIRTMVSGLQASFLSFHTYNLSGYDLYRTYGIGDSRWFLSAEPIVKGKREEYSGSFSPPGVAVFGGKVIKQLEPGK